MLLLTQDDGNSEKLALANEKKNEEQLHMLVSCMLPSDNVLSNVLSLACLVIK